MSLPRVVPASSRSHVPRLWAFLASHSPSKILPVTATLDSRYPARFRHLPLGQFGPTQRMDNKLIPIEEQARSVEQTVSSQPSDKAALDAAIKSAELYFQALRLADNPHDKVRLDAKVNGLLAQAEHLKNGQDAKTPNARPTYRDNPKVPVSTRKLTTRENIILLEGAKLNGFIFKPWPGPPSQTEFAPRDGEPLFTDSAPLSLSAAQRESFDGWKRPHQALRSVLGDGDTQNNPGDGAVMHLSVPMDLVQDMTSDCSVVASLCALTSRFERGFPKVGIL